MRKQQQLWGRMLGTVAMLSLASPAGAFAIYTVGGDAACGYTEFVAADLVSFEPDKVEITIDGQKLEPAPGQSVIAHGPDRNLSVDEVGGIRLPDHESPVGVRA